MHEEDEEFIYQRADMLISKCLNDFPDSLDTDQADLNAAKITRAAITNGTRNGHKRIIKAYIAFYFQRMKGWDARAVTEQTPKHIMNFIIQKCSPKEAEYKGKKYSIVVSTRAALTYWYQHVRPHDNICEWRVDPDSRKCYGLPTRSHEVSKFMLGLERTKAQAGEVSQSACALNLADMLKLYEHIFDTKYSQAELRHGIVCWAVYLISWLTVLRIDKALSLDIDSVDMNPNQCQYFKLHLKPQKCAQTGVTRVWQLWANDAEPKICPVRALIQLACLYKDDFGYSGPLFLYVDQNRALQNSRMTPDIISRALAIDLQKLGYCSWTLYGTHSFRCGGTQYRFSKEWSPGMVAAWGGWSQAEAVTMFCYAYSPNDNYEYLAEYDRNSAEICCSHCGRTNPLSW